MNLEQRHSNANLKRLRDEISKLQNGDGKEPSPKEELKNQEMKKEEMKKDGSQVKEADSDRLRLTRAKTENARLRGVIESLCGSLVDVQELWLGEGLPVPVPSHVKEEEMQRRAMEEMANFLEKLSLSGKLQFSEDVRHVMGDWIAAARSKTMQQCHKMVSHRDCIESIKPHSITLISERPYMKKLTVTLNLTVQAGFMEMLLVTTPGFDETSRKQMTLLVNAARQAMRDGEAE